METKLEPAKYILYSELEESNVRVTELDIFTKPPPPEYNPESRNKKLKDRLRNESKEYERQKRRFEKKAKERFKNEERFRETIPNTRRKNMIEIGTEKDGNIKMEYMLNPNNEIEVEVGKGYMTLESWANTNGEQYGFTSEDLDDVTGESFGARKSNKGSLGGGKKKRKSRKRKRSLRKRSKNRKSRRRRV